MNLILYYSMTGDTYVNGKIVYLTKGNTERCAEFIQKAVGGDLFHLETIHVYPDDHYELIAEAKKETENKERPELKKYIENLDDYENVFVCGPCWWGTYPMAVFTQLEKLDFTGKKVLPLMTHEGSGLANSVNDLKKVCTGAIFSEPIAIHGADAEKSEKVVSEWAKKNIEE